MKLKTHIAASLLLVAVSSATEAEDVERLRLAHELVRLSSPSNMLEEVRGRIYECNPNFKMFRNSFDKFLNKQMSILIDCIAQGYANELTEAELRELIKICGTPIVQKFMRTHERAGELALQAWSKYFQEHPDLQDELVKEMEKEQELRMRAQPPFPGDSQPAQRGSRTPEK